MKTLLVLTLLCHSSGVVSHQWACVQNYPRCETRDPTGTIVFVQPLNSTVRYHGRHQTVRVRCMEK